VTTSCSFAAPLLPPPFTLYNFTRLIVIRNNLFIDYGQIWRMKSTCLRTRKKGRNPCSATAFVPDVKRYTPVILDGSNIPISFHTTRISRQLIARYMRNATSVREAGPTRRLRMQISSNHFLTPPCLTFPWHTKFCSSIMRNIALLKVLKIPFE
jgi:hypothetical protein